jgi:hypothetical protein
LVSEGWLLREGTRQKKREGLLRAVQQEQAKASLSACFVEYCDSLLEFITIHDLVTSDYVNSLYSIVSIY